MLKKYYFNLIKKYRKLTKRQTKLILFISQTVKFSIKVTIKLTRAHFIPYCRLQRTCYGGSRIVNGGSYLRALPPLLYPICVHERYFKRNK